MTKKDNCNFEIWFISFEFQAIDILDNKTMLSIKIKIQFQCRFWSHWNQHNFVWAMIFSYLNVRMRVYVYAYCNVFLFNSWFKLSPYIKSYKLIHVESKQITSMKWKHADISKRRRKKLIYKSKFYSSGFVLFVNVVLEWRKGRKKKHNVAIRVLRCEIPALSKCFPTNAYNILLYHQNILKMYALILY